MPYLFLALWLLLGLPHAYAQEHRIHLQAGWTASYIQRYAAAAPLGTKSNFVDARSVSHAPYIGLEYEHGFTRSSPCDHWQLSTGLHVLTFGANRALFPNALPNADTYLTLPLLLGHVWRFNRRWQLTIEGGTEVGFALQQRSDPLGNTWGNVNVVAAIEVGWHRLRFGTRLQVGVTDYRLINDSIYRHSGLTTYVGYRLWSRE